jgi:hypothetical protein
MAQHSLSAVGTDNGSRPDHEPPASTAPSPGIDDDTMRLVKRGLRENLTINQTFRSLVGIFGLTAAVLAMLYTWQRGDRMVQLLNQGRLDAERVLTLSLPVVLFGAFAGLSVAVAWGLHSRSQEELCRTLDTLSRLKREGEVAVSARGLMFAFEEKLNNARRAFMLLLWFGRTLFILCLGLFAVAAIRSIADHRDLFTLALGVTSVAGSLLAVATGVPKTVKQHLSDVIQVQSIVTGCDRQISLLESYALSVMNSGVGQPATHELVLEVQDRMDTVVQGAVKLMQRYAEPGGLTPSETGEDP